MKLILLLGRILFAFIFIKAGLGHFSSGPINAAASHGVPMADILVPISGVLALVGGASILLGFKARFGAWLIALFLIPVTLFMHDFWNVTDPQMAMMQQVNFTKNMALLGGAFIISYFGSGAWSIDALLHHNVEWRKPRKHAFE